MIPKFPIQDHIYIFNSYICTFDWGKLEIPKVYIQHYIYITYSYIYILDCSLLEKRKDLSVLAHENYICNSEKK